MWEPPHKSKLIVERIGQVKLKRTVTIEFDRVIIKATHCAENFFRCELCGAEAEFFNQAQAAQLVKAMRMQGLSVNQANLHFYQRDGQQILICLNSIINRSNSGVNKLIS
jgi:hypothetical protein